MEDGEKTLRLFIVCVTAFAFFGIGSCSLMESRQDALVVEAISAGATPVEAWCAIHGGCQLLEHAEAERLRNK